MRTPDCACGDAPAVLSHHFRPSPSHPSPKPWRHALAGLAVFVMGLLLYVVGRDPSQLWLHPASWSWPAAGARLPQALRDSGPSLAHVLAFSLFSATALPRRLWLPACAAWFAFDTLVELAQLPQAQAWAVQHGLCAWPRGAFDPTDLLALLLGALCAAAVLARPSVIGTLTKGH